MSGTPDPAYVLHLELVHLSLGSTQMLLDRCGPDLAQQRVMLHYQRMDLKVQRARLASQRRRLLHQPQEPAH